MRPIPLGYRVAFALILAASPLARAQTPPAPPASAETADPRLAAAQLFMGRALFLRNFYSGSDLSYDASSHIQGTPPPHQDWTLSAFDLQSVTQPKPGQLELAGLRVAIRYNPDAHTFDRHPLKNQPIHIHLAEPATPAALKSALIAIFSTGIDPAFQRSTPPLWRHYFEPAAPWEADPTLPTTPILGSNGKLPAEVTPPAPTGQPRAAYTAEATQDRVQGTLALRVVVDAEGTPRRISIVRPLGYGLDASAAEAISRWRFQPGTQDGKPVPVEIIVNQEFSLTPPMK